MSQGAAGPHPVRQRPGRPSNGPAPSTPQGRRSRTAPPGPPPQPALGPSILLRPDAPWRRRPATGSGCRLLERPGKKQLHRKRKRKRKRQHCVWMGIYRLSCCDVQVWAQHSVFPLAWPGHAHTLRTPRPCVPSVPGQCPRSVGLRSPASVRDRRGCRRPCSLAAEGAECPCGKTPSCPLKHRRDRLTGTTRALMC